MVEQTLPTPDLCGRIATIGATDMRCENHAGHAEPCWYNVPDPSSAPISPPSPAETPPSATPPTAETPEPFVWIECPACRKRQSYHGMKKCAYCGQEAPWPGFFVLTPKGPPTETQTATTEPKPYSPDSLDKLEAQLAAWDRTGEANFSITSDAARRLIAMARQSAPRAAQPATTELTKLDPAEALVALGEIQTFFDSHCTGHPDCPIPHAASDIVRAFLAEFASTPSPTTPSAPAEETTHGG